MKILGIGNAIVDVICKIDENFLIKNNLTKSTMKLVDEKEFKQLLSNFKQERIPNKIIESIVHSNDTRKDWIANMILQKDGVSVVGIHRLIMKSGSDNYRSSAIQGIIERLVNDGVKVIIFEPNVNAKEFMGCVVETNLSKFKKLSDLIVTNRLDKLLKDVEHKTYTRDIFHDN